MSDPQQSAQNSQMLQGEPSPEELEAAQAANEADALTPWPGPRRAGTLQAKNTELADSTCAPRPTCKTPAAAPTTNHQGPQVRRRKPSPKACCR
jgi:hypothetical protein